MMSLRGFLVPLLMAALCSAAPYEETSSSTAAPPLPEKLVETGRSVQCHVQQVTIWDTEYQDQPFEVSHPLSVVRWREV